MSAGTRVQSELPPGDSSPPLKWGPVPNGTKSIAVIVEDRTVPGRAVTDWLVYGIPPGVNELAKGVPRNEALASGARQGTNDFNEVGYSGPCDAVHFSQYSFKVYALDNMIDLPQGATRSDLRAATEKRVLAQGEITGRYRTIRPNGVAGS